MSTELTTRLRERLEKWANAESDPTWEDGALRMMGLLWPVIEAAQGHMCSDEESKQGRCDFCKALAELERAL